MITNVKPLQIANAQHFCTASLTLPSPAILYVREVGPQRDYPLVDQLPHQPERGNPFDTAIIGKSTEKAAV